MMAKMKADFRLKVEAEIINHDGEVSLSGEDCRGIEVMLERRLSGTILTQNGHVIRVGFKKAEGRK